MEPLNGREMSYDRRTQRGGRGACSFPVRRLPEAPGSEAEVRCSSRASYVLLARLTYLEGPKRSGLKVAMLLDRLVPCLHSFLGCV